MRVVVEDVLPLMGTADVVRNRQGAIEAISCIFFFQCSSRAVVKKGMVALQNEERECSKKIHSNGKLKIALLFWLSMKLWLLYFAFLYMVFLG